MYCCQRIVAHNCVSTKKIIIQLPWQPVTGTHYFINLLMLRLSPAQRGRHSDLIYLSQARWCNRYDSRLMWVHCDCAIAVIVWGVKDSILVWIKPNFLWIFVVYHCRCTVVHRTSIYQLTKTLYKYLPIMSFHSIILYIYLSINIYDISYVPLPKHIHRST